MNLFKKIGRGDKYSRLLDGYEWIDQLKKLLLFDGMPIGSYDTPNILFSNIYTTIIVL